ncbi:MAG TPA: signal peptidase I [Gaiellaceae bacterium]|nr:signal peptidase I [Gaiellaceae bacterium]
MNAEPTAALTPPVRRGALIRAGGRHVLWFVAVIAFAAAVSVWAVFLRPQLLGGPASYVLVAGTSMKPTLHTGDLVIAMKQRSYRPGEIIVYHVPSGPGKGSLIIHRIVGGSGQIGYLTKGDNRQQPDQWNPKAQDVDGRLVVHVPRAGLVLLWLRSPLGVAVLAALVAFAVMWSGESRSAGAPNAPAPDRPRT